MVPGWKNVELALNIEKEEVIDRVAETNLVDNWLEQPNLHSQSNQVVSVNINILWWKTILFKFQYTPPVPHSTLESRSGKNRLYFIP